MPRARDHRAYPSLFYDIVEALASGTEDLHFDFPQAHRAVNFRQDFYSFRTALANAQKNPSMPTAEKARAASLHTMLLPYKVCLDPPLAPKSRLTPDAIKMQNLRPTRVTIIHSGRTEPMLALSAQLKAQLSPGPPALDGDSDSAFDSFLTASGLKPSDIE